MSHLHIQQLGQVETDFLAIERAVMGVLSDRSVQGYGALQTAAQGLETVYIVRLFSEFESILRAALLLHAPTRLVPRTAHHLINRAARQFGVPDPIRDHVHLAREYRNSVVHASGLRTTALNFEQTMRSFNRFLIRLP